jgi:hypothetical protein
VIYRQTGAPQRCPVKAIHKLTNWRLFPSATGSEADVWRVRERQDGIRLVAPSSPD